MTKILASVLLLVAPFVGSMTDLSCAYGFPREDEFLPSRDVQLFHRGNGTRVDFGDGGVNGNVGVSGLIEDVVRPGFHSISSGGLKAGNGDL